MKTLSSLTLILLCAAGAASACRAQGFEMIYDQTISIKNLDQDIPRKARTYPVFAPLPVYPSELLFAGIAGSVSVKFLVHEDGSIGDVTIVETSMKEFGPPTKEMIEKWKFHPVTDRRTRAPTTVWMRCQVVFKTTD